MTEDKRDELIANLLDARTRNANHVPATADAELLAEVAPLLEVAELLWVAGHGAPPLESDPVAAMLGLVPDPRYALDRDALKRARRNAKLKPSGLAALLQARGWDVQVGDVFRWENQSAADVSPALIRAIAEECSTDPDQLVAHRQDPGERDVLAAMTQTSEFIALVRRWARIQRTSPGLAASTLKARALATVHRGDRPDPDQLLASLEALVAALESGGEQHGPR
ncbi:hypothetical protein [Actinophytocola sp.]|uniref:hypothetical protein n=1 Tax=Actinophytocola sp. TaxID=1872138 RepID=UPI003D6A5A74